MKGFGCEKRPITGIQAGSSVKAAPASLSLFSYLSPSGSDRGRIMSNIITVQIWRYFPLSTILLFYMYIVLDSRGCWAVYALCMSVAMEANVCVCMCEFSVCSAFVLSSPRESVSGWTKPKKAWILWDCNPYWMYNIANKYLFMSVLLYTMYRSLSLCVCVCVCRSQISCRKQTSTHSCLHSLQTADILYTV